MALMERLERIERTLARLDQGRAPAGSSADHAG
jgi:hypothetical protein